MYHQRKDLLRCILTLIRFFSERQIYLFSQFRSESKSDYPENGYTYRWFCRTSVRPGSCQGPTHPDNGHDELWNVGGTVDEWFDDGDFIGLFAISRYDEGNPWGRD